MSKYKRLDKYLERKKKTPAQKTKAKKAYKDMTASERDALVEKMLRDFGYIK